MLLAAAALPCAPDDGVADPRYREALRVAVERLRYGDELPTAAARIHAGRLVAEFYERRSFLPAWQDDQKIGSLIAAVEDALADGLDPSDYHLRSIAEQYTQCMTERSTNPEEWAAFELQLTDSLISLVHHQRFGKADPLGQHVTWNYRGQDDGPGTLELAERAITAPSIAVFLVDAMRRGAYYIRLRGALASYRRILDAGGWPVIAGGQSLNYGTVDDRVAVLATRLAITGDIDDAERYAAATTMDGKLQDAVRRFQRRHALEPDGVVGPATIRALNVPVEQRIEQLRLSLERARWVLHGIRDNFVVVNIAGFNAYVVVDRKIIWETRVVVGKAQQQTPVFRDELQHIVFNPSWTVPYSIATREMLPEIKSQPDWFATHDFDLRDLSGARVDPSNVDWATVTPRSFNYLLVQRPGPNNALGQIKFSFPNEQAVYLHDTPARQLFGSTERAFSHGCIRVENPLKLAEILLAPNGWDRARIDAAVADQRMRTVFLARPLPILLLYWTANVTPDGVIHFYRDVYGRDPGIATALDGPFQIT